MSQENVEIVREVIEAADRRDAEAAFAHYAPEIEWDAYEVGAGVPVPPGLGRVARGHDELRAWLSEWLNAWESAEYEQEGLIDAGDKVVQLLRMRVRGRGSGIELEYGPYAQLWTLRDGMIVRMKLFADQAEALEAAGLRE
jgi:ketosteroid isomerase-like protein